MVDAGSRSALKKQRNIYWFSQYCDAESPRLFEALAADYRVHFQQLSQLCQQLVQPQFPAPVAILLECDLPSMALFRCLFKLKALHPALPVVMVCKSCSQRFLLWALRQGIWDVYIGATEPGPEPLLQRIASLPQREFSPLVMTLQSGMSLQRKNSLDYKRLQPAMLKIENEFSRKITEYELAECCLMSVHHFSRLFKKTYGVVLQEYIVRRRLLEAQRLLLEAPEQQIAAIAYSVGFKDPSYFGRVFKRIYKMTPSRYRDSLNTQRISA